MKWSNKHSAFYRSLTFSCLALVFGGLLLWYVNRPQYLRFSVHTPGQSKDGLELYYPADWVPAHLQSTYGWNYSSVVFERRSPSGLDKWIDEHMYRITPQDWKKAVIRVQWMNGRDHGASDMDAEENRLRSSMNQLAKTGNPYTLRRARFTLGPALVAELKNQKAGGRFRGNAYDSIIVFPSRAPGQAGSEVVVAYSVPERLKDRVQQTAIEIINHLRLVENK